MSEPMLTDARRAEEYGKKIDEQAARIASLKALLRQAQDYVISATTDWEVGSNAQSLSDEISAALAPAPAPEGKAASLRALFAPFLVDNCGCTPVCQCNSQESLRIWKEDARQAMEDALTPAPAPAYVNKDGPCDKWAPGAYEMTAPSLTPEKE